MKYINFISGLCVNILIRRPSYNGITSASQADDTGSIPVGRSTVSRITDLALFLLGLHQPDCVLQHLLLFPIRIHTVMAGPFQQLR